MCRPLSLGEAQRLPPIPSSYEAESVLQLGRHAGPRGIAWELREIELPHPFRATYDDGTMAEWMESYTESTPIESFRFVGAYLDDSPCGLLTWQEIRWNNTVWLVDIRVRAENRRKGVGSALVRWLQNSARSGGARGITLETQASNLPAIRFYQRHAFRIAGFHDRFYDNEDDSPDGTALFLFWETPPTGS